MQLYIQHQICYRAKNPSLMNHHFCLLIPSDWLKVRPWRQHQHQSSLQCVRVFSNVVMTDWYMRIRISICTLEWMMNLYSALCIVVHPKRFTIMLGGSLLNHHQAWVVCQPISLYNSCLKTAKLTPNQPKFCPPAQANISLHNQIQNRPIWQHCLQGPLSMI